MAITSTFYGDLEEADAYFAGRLHDVAWTANDAQQHTKALLAATRIIDTLAYKGYKATVAAYLETLGAGVQPDASAVAAAEAAQAHEFPRGSDTEVPEAIRTATYEIAYSLLDGKDPELELENLGITSQGYSSLRTSYSRDHTPIEHIVNGVPNAQAWRLIRPFLRDDQAVRLSRVS